MFIYNDEETDWEYDKQNLNGLGIRSKQFYVSSYSTEWSFLVISCVRERKAKELYVSCLLNPFISFCF